ncbi:aluminum-activated malate transporter 9-like [Lolium perenne]|uniref:aluminum-activated malate transporter 9-like n=1 Tax=Lolium perenne TaxID=4522 RepID=UPI003A98DEE6
MEETIVICVLCFLNIVHYYAGATLNKCFNRGLGTLTAGGLALAVAVLSKNLGKMEDMILITSIFTVAFCANLAKLHPKMKPYDYGFRIFLVTYVIVMVSGYNTRKITDKVVSRFLLIGLGTALTIGINICIYPIWSGEDLHNSVAKNFAGVAKSLEGCVDGYLKCVDYERIPSRLHTYQASDDSLYSGYREAIEESVKEETLLGFAIWEPPHGPYKMMGYPWKSFTKVGGALRHCYFAVMALHGCIHSEIQASPEKRKVFIAQIHKVGREGAKVLCELGNNVKTMTKLRSSDILFDVHLAAEELQKKIDEKSYLLVNIERWNTSKHDEGINDALNGSNVHAKEMKNEVTEPKIGDQILVNHYRSLPANSFVSIYDSQSTMHDYKALLSWPARRSFHPKFPLEDEESKTYESASALSLATFASLLIEFVARLQNLVNAFEELSDKANFKEHVEEPGAVKTGHNQFLAEIWKYVGPKS